MLYLMKELLRRDTLALLISVVSLIIAFTSLRTARSVFRVNLREQWIEKFSQEIRACLPANYIPGAAGLRVARLADALPAQLRSKRREIIEHGYFRAVPGGGFAEFWVHLCEIQGWASEKPPRPAS